ncbi:MAG: phage tail sheath subtilisin-like domain-containing protein [Myxococcales bacterium]|nr:phage tail sheath subtilisin-like domain-containing protein [Myxococcales bacterium]
MPGNNVAEYLAPAVYVEETSFRSKSIEGVSTSTAGFVGPTRRGPSTGAPELLTRESDFERIYGGTGRLTYGGTAFDNYMALSVKAFFDNGGRRLYVRRVVDGGVAATSGTALTNVVIAARHVGSGGNGSATMTLAANEVSGAALAALPIGSVVRWETPDGGGGTVVNLAVLTDTGFVTPGTTTAATPASPSEALSIDFVGVDADGFVHEALGLGLDASHSQFIGDVLAENPSSLAAQLANIFWVDVSAASTSDIVAAAEAADTGVPLTGGTDGNAPTSTQYATGFGDIEALDDISTVAAPGHIDLHPATPANGTAIRAELITHVEQRGLYRVALLETGLNRVVSEARTAKSEVDSKYAAMYYPGVVVANPAATGSASEPAEITIPPSGFLAGIFARSDNDNGVWKSPANEVVQGALRFERSVSFGESEVLNPLGVNCLRFFPGRGYRVWGARTASSDPEWKYLSVRRYFNYLEASIERGTQWAVFESNGPALWENVTQTIDSFLYTEWRNGALLGASPKEAYFVRCDLTTMTQNDLDNGRMVCLIGVAVVKPAEFVIFRIGQMTATSRS